MFTRNLLFAQVFGITLNIPARARAFVVFYFRQMMQYLSGEPIDAAIVDGLTCDASKD